MITFEHLIERTKSRVCNIILFYFISDMFLFLSDLENIASFVSNNEIHLSTLIFCITYKKKFYKSSTFHSIY